ncbi:MAG: FKBP-type peptidyl-prolyl cis-trans isomerase [Gemmatimonadales bacterium]|nr:FKBP-type peptidyl-prolyl cis-trans isomerase [Gemmatimonadales bacterium]
MLRAIRTPVLALALALMACGKDDPALSIEETNFAPSLGVDLAASTKTSGGLYYRDLVVGTGPLITGGLRISTQYTGWLANGTQFDAGTYTAQLGTGNVIQGWDLGIPGMKVGGRRQLIIPSALGYGAAGQGSIPPNAVLVFSVEVLAIVP